MALLENTFFMPFAITTLAIVSRLYALCKLTVEHLDGLYVELPPRL